ncbi:LuxR family transcriptional regulator [Streptomyces sp900105755]|uniref:LuxR family transcriptional regulator n=1 Tax=Streptomyces sp. 900105755 TaxID=3154389 RepID=A0ABV1TUA4_9ACTN
MTEHLPVSARALRRVPLVGRHEELRVLAGHVTGAQAQDGPGGAVLLTGEPGIGKTRLLDRLAGTCPEHRVVQTAGVRPEARLGFAALHGLLRPFLDGLDTLPPPQREALGAAFGRVSGTAADRYLVGLATLTLLAGAAAVRPLLALVDDVQWLDPESADVLAFVGRCLHGDAVALVLAGRDDRDGPDPFDGIPVLSLTGLPPADARDLLAANSAGRLDPAVADRIAAETGGNPLALLRLTRTLTAEQLSGTAPLPAALPVPGPLRAHFQRRVRALPAETRTLLLLMAAAAPQESAERWRAAGCLGIPAHAADAATAAGILTREHATGFRHPVFRSAVYWGAEAADRRLVHAALAAVTDPVRAPDRRAWHRAEATVGLDAEVAGELEAAARHARAGGGPAAQAAFLLRAAELSPTDRVPRFLAAARAHLALGNPASAQAALDRAETELGPGDALLRARVRQTRTRVDLYSARLTGIPARLLDAARSVAESDAPQARRLLVEGLAAAVVGHGGPGATTPYEFAAAVLASPALRPTDSAPADLLLRGLAARLHDDHLSAVPLLRRALQAFGSEPLGSEPLENGPFGSEPFENGAIGGEKFGSEPFENGAFGGEKFGSEPLENDAIGGEKFGSEPFENGAFGGEEFGGEEEPGWDGVPLAVLALFAAEDVWDDVGGRAACTRLAGHARDTGALGALQTALMVQALWDVRAGRFGAARSGFEEAAELAAAMDLPPHGPAQQIELLAWSGREAETRAAAAEIAEVWERQHGNDDFGDRARACLAVLETGLGRYPQALACARVVMEKDRPGTGTRVLHEVVEAGVRSGDHRAAKQALARLEERAAASGTPWAKGLLARCRALMADDEHAEAYYAESVELLGRTGIVTEAARSRLLYGEWLRRRRRRGQARDQLRTAHRMFAGMGAVAFAERARAGLAATGEQARTRTGPAGRALTRREREVARLAAGGVMNADIAVRLFISVSTVEYHLGKVFRKLGVTSRRHLTSVLDAEARLP